MYLKLRRLFISVSIIINHFLYSLIVTEYCEGGDLFTYVQTNGIPSEKRVADIIHKILLAVYFIHSFGIVHRDIKLNNILLSDNSDQADVRLLDFGLSTILGPGEKCADSYGTLVRITYMTALNRTLLLLKFLMRFLMIKRLIYGVLGSLPLFF